MNRRRLTIKQRRAQQRRSRQRKIYVISCGWRGTGDFFSYMNLTKERLKRWGDIKRYKESTS